MNTTAMRIGEVAERVRDRIDKLRAEFRAGVLQLYLDELHADANKYATFARQNGIDLNLGSQAET